MSHGAEDERRGRSRARRSALHAVLAVLALLAADRLALALLADEGWFQGKRLAPFPTAALQSGLADAVRGIRSSGTDGLVESGFDPELGWEPRPGRTEGEPGADTAGARPGGDPTAGVAAAGVRRILAFGCSFTFGTEVSGEEAWPARLEALRGDLEVLNLGVPAYGLDQALLRMERRAPGLAPAEIWLGLMPSAAQRPSTHFLPLLRPWTGIVWFKGRFEIDQDGAFRRFPAPVDSVEATLEAYERPGRLAELLAGRDPWFDAVAPAFSHRLEHTTFVGRLYWTRRVFRLAKNSMGTLPDGRSLVPLHFAIAREARALAGTLDARFRYLILPCAGDLAGPDGSELPFCVDLRRALAEAGIEVLDVAPAVVSVPSEERWAAGGHYSVRTNAAVATWLSAQVE